MTTDSSNVKDTPQPEFSHGGQAGPQSLTAHERKLDRLLARGGFSGAEREEIFYASLQASTSLRRASWRMSMGYAAAAVALVVLPVALWSSFEGGYRSKGSAVPIEAVCRDRCQESDKILFRVTPEARGFLAAYAEAEDGQLIWYFPSQNSDMPKLSHASGAFLTVGVRIGAEHRPGRHQVHLAVFEHPLDQTSVLRAVQNDTVRHWTQSLEVRP